MDRRSTPLLSTPAYDYLVDMILTKQLFPGDRISEVFLAEKFGVSRTPVRDALRRLSNEGLVEIFPNRFAQVSSYSLEQIREIGLMRLTLDRLAIQLALLHGSKVDFLSLQKTAQECLNARERGNILAQQRLDCQFHMELTRLSKNSLLIKFQNELYMRVLFILVHYPHTLIDEKKQLEDHLLIVDALTSQDKETALHLISDNIVSFYGLKNTIYDLYNT